MKYTIEPGSIAAVDTVAAYILDAHGVEVEDAFVEGEAVIIDAPCDIRLSACFKATGLKVKPYVPEEVRAPTVFSEQDYIPIVDEIIHRKVREYGYDNIVSACSYSTSTIPKFQDEGRAFSKWRDLVWVRCFEISAQARTSGEWPEPAEAAASLPVFEDVLASINA